MRNLIKIFLLLYFDVTILFLVETNTTQNTAKVNHLRENSPRIPSNTHLIVFDCILISQMQYTVLNLLFDRDLYQDLILSWEKKTNQKLMRGRRETTHHPTSYQLNHHSTNLLVLLILRLVLFLFPLRDKDPRPRSIQFKLRQVIIIIIIIIVIIVIIISC